MTRSFESLTFTPDSAALETLHAEWSWVLPPVFELVLFSIFGDVFYRDSSGSVLWLNTGTGEVVRIADSDREFQRALTTELADEWFLPDLVEQLHSAGKVPSPGQCYTYAILPVFAEGKYEVWNFKPVSAREHFSATAHVLRQIAGLPEGAKVKLTVVE